jgi:hypothetical protein
VTRVGILHDGDLAPAAGHRPPGATVDDVGVVAGDGLGWTLDWRIGADDRWRIPQRETAVRQSLTESAPVVRTAMRVPGGDAISEVYGVPDSGGVVVVEMTNDSPAPVVVSFVVRGARSVALDGPTVVVDNRRGLLLPRTPSRWSVTRGGSTDVEVCGGAAREGPFPPTRDRAGRVEAAFLLPLPHRATLRAAIAPTVASAPVDLTRVPTAADAARGWVAQLRRGMRVAIPHDRLTAALTGARAQVLLAAQESRPSGLAIAALEDWGFDAEVADAWRRAGSRERRRARERPARPPQARELEVLLEHSRTPEGLSRVSAELLLCARAVLVWEGPDATLVLLPELPDGWRGRDLDVQAAPTRAGLLSYSVRWHGERPALLWSAPPTVRVCAPGLDAEWASDEAEGEALLTGSAA